MAHKIEMGRKAFEELRDEVFKDFPPEVRDGIGLGCHKDKRLVSCNIICAGVYAEAKAKCSPQDEWDERTGILLALIRLRINLIAKMQKKEKKENKSNERWIPKVGEEYYIYFVAGFEPNLIVGAEVYEWRNDGVDALRLARGNVFKTKREAIKAARKLMYEGRKLIKEQRVS